VRTFGSVLSHRSPVGSVYLCHARAVVVVCMLSRSLTPHRCPLLLFLFPSRFYAPCGLIANSLFNDTIQIFDEAGASVELRGDGIAWSSDLSVKFANPAIPDGLTLCDAPGLDNETTHSPPNWWIRACQLGAENETEICTSENQNQTGATCRCDTWPVDTHVQLTRTLSSVCG
jgi:hypothetical protein